MIRRWQKPAIRKVIMIHHNTGLPRIGFYLINTSRPTSSWELMHVLALELLRLSK